MPNRRRSTFTKDPKYKQDVRELERLTHQNILIGKLAGWSDKRISRHTRVREDAVQQIVEPYVRYIWRVIDKWRNAEVKCRALGIENRLLRIGQLPPPDRQIEDLRPPSRYLRNFKKAGIETINQLRATDTTTLLAYWRFPKEAIDWAIMTLDRMGLSHSLAWKRHRSVHREVIIGTRKWVIKEERVE